MQAQASRSGMGSSGKDREALDSAEADVAVAATPPPPQRPVAASTAAGSTAELCALGLRPAGPPLVPLAEMLSGIFLASSSSSVITKAAPETSQFRPKDRQAGRTCLERSEAEEENGNEEEEEEELQASDGDEEKAELRRQSSVVELQEGKNSSSSKDAEASDSMDYDSAADRAIEASEEEGTGIEEEEEGKASSTLVGMSPGVTTMDRGLLDGKWQQPQTGQDTIQDNEQNRRGEAEPLSRSQWGSLLKNIFGRLQGMSSLSHSQQKQLLKSQKEQDLGEASRSVPLTASVESPAASEESVAQRTKNEEEEEEEGLISTTAAKWEALAALRLWVLLQPLSLEKSPQDENNPSFFSVYRQWLGGASGNGLHKPHIYQAADLPV